MLVFTAMHGMQTWSSDENSACPSVCLSNAVASLGWVSPGAATEGVASIFFTGDIFSYPRLPALGCHPYLFSPEQLTIFLPITVTFIDFTRVLPPPGGCHPHLLYLSDLVYALFFVGLNLPTICFLRVSPPGGYHPGRSAP